MGPCRGRWCGIIIIGNVTGSTVNNIFIVVTVLAMMIGPRYSLTTTTTILGHDGGGGRRRHGRVIKIGGNAFPCRLVVVGRIGPGRIIRDHHMVSNDGSGRCGGVIHYYRVNQRANVGRRIRWDAR